MRSNLVSSALAVVVLTVGLGLAYPLVITGISQVAFPARANGEPRLLAHPVNGARYFQPRPSQTHYDPHATAFSNRGPNQQSAEAFYAGQVAAYLKRERPYARGLTAAGIPSDAVTTSGSGVDPDISPANAAIQAHRVATVRGLPLARVNALIAAHTDNRALGVLGEPGVDTTTLNEALGR